VKTLTIGKKRSAGGSQDAARKCGGVGAGQRDGDYRADVLDVASSRKKTTSSGVHRIVSIPIDIDEIWLNRERAQPEKFKQFA
jgi:hypothetical protein